MKILPRYLAAAQFTMLGTFCAASWWTLLSPVDRAAGQLEVLFAPGYALRAFFLWFAVLTVLAVAIGVIFWFKKAATRPLASTLVLLAGCLLALAVWRFNATLIFNCALGLCFATWSWFRPDIA